MKQFKYKGFTFTYSFRHDVNHTWTIVECRAKNIEVVGDGLACGKWQATRKLNEILKSEPQKTPYGAF
jgi:uncharacterized NAD-dependent epimerase/dehydratase family protein